MLEGLGNERLFIASNSIQAVDVAFLQRRRIVIVLARIPAKGIRARPQRQRTAGRARFRLGIRQGIEIEQGWQEARACWPSVFQQNGSCSPVEPRSMDNLGSCLSLSHPCLSLEALALVNDEVVLTITNIGRGSVNGTVGIPDWFAKRLSLESAGTGAEAVESASNEFGGCTMSARWHPSETKRIRVLLRQ